MELQQFTELQAALFAVGYDVISNTWDSSQTFNVCS